MRIIYLLAFAGCLMGQVRFQRLEIIPSADDSQVGVLRFRELRANGLSAFQIAAPLSLSSSIFVRWPSSQGDPGQCLKRVGTEEMEWQDCGGGAVPLVLSSDTSPQLQIKGLTDPNKQLLIGYNTTSQVGEVQALEQGVAFRTLALQPYGGWLGVGTVNPEAYFHVNGPGIVRGLCVRDDIAAEAGWCFDSDATAGGGKLTLKDRTGAAMFVLDQSNNRASLNLDLTPAAAGAGSKRLGRLEYPWSELWADNIRFASDLVGSIGTNLAKPANIHTGTLTAYSTLLVRNGATATFQSGSFVSMDDADVTTLDVANLLRVGGQIGFLVDGVSNVGSPSVRPNAVYANQVNTRAGFTSTFGGRVNLSGALGAPNGSDGITRIINIRCADGTNGGMTVSAGVITACTCP